MDITIFTWQLCLHPPIHLHGVMLSKAPGNPHSQQKIVLGTNLWWKHLRLQIPSKWTILGPQNHFSGKIVSRYFRFFSIVTDWQQKYRRAISWMPCHYYSQSHYQWFLQRISILVEKAPSIRQYAVLCGGTATMVTVKGLAKIIIHVKHVTHQQLFASFKISPQLCTEFSIRYLKIFT